MLQRIVSILTKLIMRFSPSSAVREEGAQYIVEDEYEDEYEYEYEDDENGNSAVFGFF